MSELGFNKKIRLLIVDDSYFFRAVLKNGLDADPRIEVIGMAANAEEAFQKIQQLKPDVVTMDVEMPKLNGIDFIKRLIPVHPVPVVVVSSLPLRVLDALEAGAVDFVRKPSGDTPSDRKSFMDELCLKVKIASVARVRSKAPACPAPVLSNLSGKNLPNDLVIAIGASTGGTDAILEVVKDLPANTPGIVIVQHMCSATSFLRNWDSILEKKRANLRSISEPARLRQPPPRSTGSAHARGRAQSIREERRIAAPPVLFALLWVRLLSALYGPFCGPLRPFDGCPRGVTPPP